jgi:hypothetical protein
MHELSDWRYATLLTLPAHDDEPQPHMRAHLSLASSSLPSHTQASVPVYGLSPATGLQVNTPRLSPVPTRAHVSASMSPCSTSDPPRPTLSLNSARSAIHPLYVIPAHKGITNGRCYWCDSDTEQSSIITIILISSFVILTLLSISVAFLDSTLLTRSVHAFCISISCRRSC